MWQNFFRIFTPSWSKPSRRFEFWTVRPEKDADVGLNRGCLRLNWSRSEEAIGAVIERARRNDNLVPFGF
jgi:hypothetical protein